MSSYLVEGATGSVMSLWPRSHPYLLINMLTVLRIHRVLGRSRRFVAYSIMLVLAGDREVRYMASENPMPKLVGSVLLCEAAGAIGSIYSYDGVRDWYPKLRKPTYTPPSWLFGPVWTLLYAMMGLSLCLASQQRRKEDGGVWRASRLLFGTQLALNVLWSYVFFGRRAPGWALVEILFLWVAIAATIAAFFKISRSAALLLLPYLLWTGFAAILNHSIWRLNR